MVQGRWSPLVSARMLPASTSHSEFLGHDQTRNRPRPGTACEAAEPSTGRIETVARPDGIRARPTLIMRDPSPSAATVPPRCPKRHRKLPILPSSEPLDGKRMRSSLGVHRRFSLRPRHLTLGLGHGETRSIRSWRAPAHIRCGPLPKVRLRTRAPCRAGDQLARRRSSHR